MTITFKKCVAIVDALQVEYRQDEIRLGVRVEDQMLFEAWLEGQVDQGPRRAWELRIAATALARAGHALAVHGCEDDPTVPGGKGGGGDTKH